MSKELTLAIYNQIGWLTIAVAAIVLLLSPIVTRWMHLDTLKDEDVTDDWLGGAAVGEPQAAGVHPEVRND